MWHCSAQYTTTSTRWSLQIVVWVITSNNDIKFRYIKAFGKITPENLLKFESLFEYELDKQKQRSLYRKVEKHEQRVEQRTWDLEQARLTEAQDEQLCKEVESIKQKK